jgi:hypothetical protein
MSKAKKQKQTKVKSEQNQTFKIRGNIPNLTRYEYCGTATLRGTWFEVQWNGMAIAGGRASPIA